MCQNTKKTDLSSIMSNLQANYCLKFDFQKVDQHAGGKWLIHDTKRRRTEIMTTSYIWKLDKGFTEPKYSLLSV